VKSRQDNADKFFTDMLNNYKQETVAERAVNAQLRVQIEVRRKLGPARCPAHADDDVFECFCALAGDEGEARGCDGEAGR